ncbi:unnamed protein product [Rhizoctonia solani]|uniref:SCP domain-containing protein n=1 Tax=Rhizoctonia solani TaxID=456999 RepID=A0A8H3BJF0_9AGAM|nr:unnamed protein product [Rhizoctonia solani]
MTRFSVVASIAVAAGFAAAAPAPVIPHDRFHNYQVANANWNWNGQVPDWLAVRPGVQTFSRTRTHTRHHHHHTKWYYTRTRTLTQTAPAPAPTATSTDVPVPTTVETTYAPEPTSEAPAPEPTSEAPAPSSEAAPSTTEAPAPEPTSTEAPVETSVEAPAETSSVPQATSTVVPTTTEAAPVTTPAPTSAAPTTSAAPSSKPSEGNSGNAEIDAYLKGHNDIRAKHGASPLTWATDLAAAAAKWAENCVWEHSKGKVGAFGENLAAGSGLGAAAAVKMWTDEASEYDPANPQYSHFTQVVWKATTEVGCAVRSCNNLLTGYSGAVNFHVCEYRKPGNVIGQFAQNVQA